MSDHTVQSFLLIICMFLEDFYGQLDRQIFLQ